VAVKVVRTGIRGFPGGGRQRAARGGATNRRDDLADIPTEQPEPSLTDPEFGRARVLRMEHVGRFLRTYGPAVTKGATGAADPKASCALTC
jgi:hypothetical protein